MRLLIFALCICVGAHPVWMQAQSSPAASDEAGLVFFYQRGSFQRTNFELHLNGQLVAERFPGRTYFFVKVPPGTLHLRTGGRHKYYVLEKTFQLEVKPGKTYYLEAVPDLDFASAALYLVQRDEADFKRRSKHMTPYADAKTTLE